MANVGWYEQENFKLAKMYFNRGVEIRFNQFPFGISNLLALPATSYSTSGSIGGETITILANERQITRDLERIDSPTTL